jgi:hypothetical protein
VEELRERLGYVLLALTACACDKVMTPPDRLGREGHDQTGVAFYDFRAAMGGEGSMAKFLAMDLAQGDGIHFNAKGAAFVGDRLVAAPSRAFAAWFALHPRAGCD